MTFERSHIEVTDAMALTFHHAITDGDIGQSDVNEIKTGLRAVLTATQVIKSLTAVKEAK